GRGGVPHHAGGKTELDTARTPNMDRLAREGICGLSVPVAAGITPGSGPSHLALFGYDPFRYEIGRGVLEALGIGFELGPDDLAARGNFCTVDEEGRIVDRRAGRIPTEKCAELVQRLRAIRLPEVEVFVEPVKEYRFVLVLRGKGLSDSLTETDPQQVGKKPLPVTALKPEAERTAQLLNTWIAEAAKVLAPEKPANMLTLRGLAKNPGLPPMSEVYGLRAAAIATYPMYRGVSRLVGMTVLDTGGETIEDEIAALRRHWADFDFFYLHVKKTDSAGEDGDFNRKVEIIEHVDTLIPDIMALNPDVVIITGDHSTPALLKSHSWHPVPTILWSRVCRADAVQEFGEMACSQGGLGVFPATDLMPLALANAGRLTKFGA
ncbi:MAG: 2,3-bisphosphoglycerate-independent phosphoglycerate mutase, partial [Anaerolineae bacterium]